jgi:hypothetical protein
MKRATTSSESNEWKKKEEASASRLRQNKQSKLKIKQEVLTSESDDTNSDDTYSYESLLEVDKESPETEESKKEDPE